MYAVRLESAIREPTGPIAFALVGDSKTHKDIRATDGSYTYLFASMVNQTLTLSAGSTLEMKPEICVSQVDKAMFHYEDDFVLLRIVSDNAELMYSVHVDFSVAYSNGKTTTECPPLKTESEAPVSVNMERANYIIKLVPTTKQMIVDLGANRHQSLLRADRTPKDRLDSQGRNSITSGVIHGNVWDAIYVSIDKDGVFYIHQYGNTHNATTIAGVDNAYIYENEGVAQTIDVRTDGNKKSTIYRVITADIQPPIDMSMFQPERVVAPTECPICFEDNNSRTLLVCKGPVYHLGCCAECAKQYPAKRGICPTCGTNGTPITEYIKSGKPFPKDGTVRIA
jgi:hypothetical protein